MRAILTLAALPLLAQTALGDAVDSCLQQATVTVFRPVTSTVYVTATANDPSPPPSKSSGVQRPVDPIQSDDDDSCDELETGGTGAPQTQAPGAPSYTTTTAYVVQEPSATARFSASSSLKWRNNTGLANSTSEGFQKPSTVFRPSQIGHGTQSYLGTGVTKASQALSTNRNVRPTQDAKSSQGAANATTSSSSNSLGASPPPASKPAKALRNVLYFTNWGIYQANYQPQMLPADRVTHVLYAFAAFGQDGTVKPFDSYADVEKHYPDDSWNDQGKNAYGCVKQLYKLKQKNRNLKTLISIGGWTASQDGKFANSVATDAQKQQFASTAVKMMGDWGMDGLDIDWEYPTNEQEAKSFVGLLKACRDALDAYAEKNAPGYHFLLTVATAAGPDHYRQLDMKGMDQYLDAWHLMAYDYAGSWDKTTGHQANINKSSSNPEATKFSTVQAVDDYIQAGIAPDKIVLGLPLYGRSFANTDGLGMAFTGVGGGTLEKGIWLYKDLPRTGAKEEVDEAVGAAWSYDAAAKELVSYDNPQSAKLKVDYLKSKGLGGALFWEASGDKTGDDSIVGAVASSLGELENSQNQLSYPGSQYDNIKNGMK
ncbi:endochitinase 1 [Purpureocillium lilacinum]|nr:endochitinase [Purpureocillium lilacinum]GJN73123.1 endochitinase 1 [Purpureocillium lilacinum]GJN83640.1 endochitinase 1 [Purpureocillium lilacinum]